jgi:hypothetical protein
MTWTKSKTPIVVNVAVLILVTAIIMAVANWRQQRDDVRKDSWAFAGYA